MSIPPGNPNAGAKATSLNTRLPALSELRHIGFSKDALIMALKLYFATTKFALPPGTVESCSFEANPDIVVTLGIRNDVSGTANKINIQAATIAAAMITYCSKVKVPLPRNGEKSLKVVGEQLNLVVKVHAEQTKMFKVDKSEGATPPEAKAPEGKPPEVKSPEVKSAEAAKSPQAKSP